jgi:hypothetical protein
LLLLLLLQAFRLPEIHGNHDYLFVCLVSLTGIYGFYVVERGLKTVIEHKRRIRNAKRLSLSLANNSPSHVVVAPPPPPHNDVNVEDGVEASKKNFYSAAEDRGTSTTIVAENNSTNLLENVQHARSGTADPVLPTTAGNANPFFFFPFAILSIHFHVFVLHLRSQIASYQEREKEKKAKGKKTTTYRR